MSSGPDSTSTRVGLILDGRFVLERAIGQGGAGTLWVATDQQSGGRVAIKLLHKTLRGSPDAVARIAREARVLIRLDHPNVARAIAIEVEGPRPYLAMELVPGVDLLEAMHDRVDRRAVFSAEEVDRIAADVGGALQRAHDAQVVHRDVKPANLRLRPDGSCVVLDFGIARVEEVARDLATTAGRTIGTYTYMSPEQARGSPEITGASDQFSLAVVLFEVLSLRRLWVRAESGAPLPIERAPPPGGNDVMSLLDRIVAGPRPRIGSLVSAYEPLDEVFVRALAPKPSSRFESIAAFVDAFRASLATCDAPQPAAPVPGRGATEARPSSNEEPDARRLPGARPWMATTTSNAITAPGRAPRDAARTASLPFAVDADPPREDVAPTRAVPFEADADSPNEDVAPTRAVPFEADEPVLNTVPRPSASPPRRRAWSGVLIAVMILGVAASAGWVAFRLAEAPVDPPPPTTPSARPSPIAAPLPAAVPQPAPPEAAPPPAEPPPKARPRVSEPPPRKVRPKAPPPPDPVAALSRRLDALRARPDDLAALRELARSIEDAASTRSPAVQTRVRRLVRASEARADLEGLASAIRVLRSSERK